MTPENAPAGLELEVKTRYAQGMEAVLGYIATLPDDTRFIAERWAIACWDQQHEKHDEDGATLYRYVQNDVTAYRHEATEKEIEKALSALKRAERRTVERENWAKRLGQNWKPYDREGLLRRIAILNGAEPESKNILNFMNKAATKFGAAGALVAVHNKIRERVARYEADLKKRHLADVKYRAMDWEQAASLEKEEVDEMVNPPAN